MAVAALKPHPQTGRDFSHSPLAQLRGEGHRNAIGPPPCGVGEGESASKYSLAWGVGFCEHRKKRERGKVLVRDTQLQIRDTRWLVFFASFGEGAPKARGWGPKNHAFLGREMKISRHDKELESWGRIRHQLPRVWPPSREGSEALFAFIEAGDQTMQ